ncbi:MAG: toll/interleukin-1 receptor domain-containing protein [Parvularculaceae bacterium]
MSYSWAGQGMGRGSTTALETYRTPRALIGSDGALGAIPERLHPIFKDREEEAAGHGITAAIETALADSEFLVVVCSPNSAKSKWVNREIAWFKTHRDKTRILALVARRAAASPRAMMRTNVFQSAAL